MVKTKNDLEIFDSSMGKISETRELTEKETLNAHVAKLIYEARTKAGLTQQQLADLVGTKQPDIARLEDADYRGHSLSMLNRIAAALNRRLEISFVPVGKSRSPN